MENIENIEIIQVKNVYGYVISQLKIDYEKKTYKKGSFRIGAHRTTKTKKEFYNIIENLKKLGFMEE